MIIRKWFGHLFRHFDTILVDIFPYLLAPLYVHKDLLLRVKDLFPYDMSEDAENFEIWKFFADFATFAKILLNFQEIADFSN